MKRYIWISTSFEGFHKWKDAPDDVGFLRDLHRHVFHVRLDIEVKHDDRELEFFQVKRQLERYLRTYYHEKVDIGSCEMIAERIVMWADTKYPGRDISVSVSEDNENGAIVRNQ